MYQIVIIIIVKMINMSPQPILSTNVWLRLHLMEFIHKKLYLNCKRMRKLKKFMNNHIFEHAYIIFSKYCKPNP